MTLSLEPLTDLAPLSAALQANGLPVDDLAEPGRLFWRAVTVGGETVGYGGLEGAGADALLRSVVLDSAQRGKGHGRDLIDLMTTDAKARGIQRLWLLTIDAAPFFAHLGFVKVARADVPPAIAASREFTALCPASAVCLMKVL